MRIIIDGPDGAGKVLLCRTISEMTGQKIVHLSHDNYERPFDLAFYINLFDENKDVIFNRSFFSEIIYARIKKRRCYISHEDVNFLVAKLKKEHSLIIHVTNDLDVLLKRFNKRGDSFMNAYELSLAKENYDIVMDSQDITLVKLNVNNELCEKLGR